MGWLIGIGILCFVIWLMVVSRGFRYLVLFIGAGIGIWIYGNIEEGKKIEVQRDLAKARAAQAQADYDAKARTLLKPDELLFTNATLKRAYSDSDEWSLSGTVTNRGSYELSSVGFNVTMQDCPSECVTIGESGAIARVSVPPGQARAFTASATFYALPQAAVPRWHYTIKTIHGVPRD
jgi:hypothetical protein